MWGDAHASATAPTIVIEPPARSIAARADCDAPETSKDSFAESSPTPRIFTPSRGFDSTPAATSASTVTGASWPSFPAFTASWMRPRLTSFRSRAFGGVKPRFGRRRCNGIWPPSKPLIATPVRAFWPLTPRPAVLPLPEPMPRPTRMRSLVAPELSRISFSFMAPSLLPVFDAHEVLDLLDHAAHRRGVGQGRDAMQLVQPEADERLALLVVPADRRADLPDADRGGFCHCALRQASAPAPSDRSASRRRDWMVETLRPRRAATARGLSSFFSALKVARTRLYGFDDPSDFATTSCMPSVSNTARIGPPAMMPVPCGAVRRITLPAPQRPLTS